ncbi:MAG: Ig-like domain-containing protein [Bacteroidaceae bacterium]|nr:Ig-like domain-containing protein [Bacteroidaceae bacterium]
MLPLVAVMLLFAAACANIGSPDGGDYDEEPPRVVTSLPLNQAINSDRKRISILFNEYVKIENASEKVIVSPPQTEAANIRAEGKRVLINLYDTLQPNTTYTIDFADAIVDNNEGNPMGNYTFSFSTGSDIDTMEVAGYVVAAEDLEPIKGIMVGLYAEPEADSGVPDSLFRTQALQRVSRTNGSGHFVIKGVAPGRRYRAFALTDMDGDFRFTQKGEQIAMDTTLFTTSCKPDIRLDTVWADSTHYDSIRPIRYTHFLPDNIVLRAFTEGGQDRHLLKMTRDVPETFTVVFTAPAPELPRIEGHGFVADSVLVAESNVGGDTITYWITDTTVAYADTLAFDFTYLDSDSLHQLTWKTDSALALTPKTTRSKQLAELAKKVEEWEKEQEKKRKKTKNLPPEENPHLTTYLAIDCKPAGSIDPNQNPVITFAEPITALPDSTSLRFQTMQDSTWVDAPYELRPVEGQLRQWQLFAEWELESQYRLQMDSASVHSVMGHHNRAFSQEFKTKKAEEYGALFIKVQLPDSNIVVQLLNASDKPVRTQTAGADGRADFFYLKPGEYYMRCFIDANADGRWTTGDFDLGRQPEEVFYFPKPMTVKAQWEIEQGWDARGIEVMKQKPEKLVKQKPDKAKQRRNRNKERKAEMQRETKKRSSTSGSMPGIGSLGGFVN